MPRIYQPGMSRNHSNPDPNHCRAAVHDSYSFGSVQCSRRFKVQWTDPETGETYGLCKQHSPDAQAERNRKAEEQITARHVKEQDRRVGWRTPDNKPADQQVCILRVPFSTADGYMFAVWHENRDQWLKRGASVDDVTAWAPAPPPPSWECAKEGDE